MPREENPDGELNSGITVRVPLLARLDTEPGLRASATPHGNRARLVMSNASLGTSVCTRCGAMLAGSAETAAACAGYWRARQAGATAATAGPDAPGRREAGAGYGRARTGAVCARDGPRPGAARNGLPG
jgi:hypothetical protein